MSLSLKLYKNYISPLTHNFLAPLTGSAHACRFEPTCSVYFAESVAKYGMIRGGFLGLSRVLRCQPFSRGGYDPVR
jgi:hypothetical protein